MVGVIRVALALSFLAPLFVVTCATDASAHVVCRTYVYSSGNRRGWRRVCWRTPERRYYTAAPYHSSRNAAWRGYPLADDEDHDNQDSEHQNSSRNLFDELDDDHARPRSTRPWREGDRNLFDEVDDTTPRVQTGSDTSPKAIGFLLFVAVLIGGATLFARFIVYLHALSQQRRADRIARKAMSARELEKRLRGDARAADEFIAAYAREAARIATSR